MVASLNFLKRLVMVYVLWSIRQVEYDLVITIGQKSFNHMFGDKSFEVEETLNVVLEDRDRLVKGSNH